MRCTLFMYTGSLLLLVLAWWPSFGSVDSQIGLSGAGADAASMNMALQYTSRQLLSLKRNYYLMTPTTTVTGLDYCGPSSIHRSTGRSYVSSSSCSIPVLNCRRRIKRLFYSGVDFTNLSAL
ncbi:hypothetical protein PO909_033829 [Leuciscus waleckii]